MISKEHLLELCVLAAVTWPVARIVGSRAFRRVFPFDAIRMSALTASYLGVVAAVAWYEPRWLRAPAVVAAGIGIYLIWRARPGFGVGTGLPPGSLSPLPVQPWTDPEFYARQTARFGPVFKMCQFGRPMVCVVGLERANRLLLEHDEQLVAPPLPFSRFIEGGYLRYLPEEIHADYRRFFHSLFHSEVLGNAETGVRSVLRDGLESMADTTRSKGSSPVRNAILKMMFEAWALLFFGIESGAEDFAQLDRQFRTIDVRRSRWASRRKIEAALAEIERILNRRIATFGSAETRTPSSFLAALAGRDPEAFADRTVFGNFIYITQVTWGDVSGLLMWILKMLSDNPSWADKLAVENSGDLAMRVVHETLRMEQSESRYRRATSELALDGFRIPKGWLVRMCVRESHRDESIFPNPMVFDPDRFAARNYTRAEYAPFGAFRLACIGANIATAVGAIFASELAGGFEWTVQRDGPTQISSWVHHAPNPSMRIRLRRRPPAD